MNEKTRDFLVKLRRFWEKARYAIVPLLAALVLYQVGVALTLLPQFKSVQYALSKRLDREVAAYSVYINDEFYGIMESEKEIQKVWGQAIARIIEETGVNYKIDAMYKLQDASSRSSEMTAETEMEEKFYQYIESQIKNYSFIGYAVHIDESIFVLRSENDVFVFFELLAKDAVDPMQYDVHCVGFENGEPVFNIQELLSEPTESIRFSGAEIEAIIEQGSIPTEGEESNNFVGIYISGEKGYQTVYVREADVLSPKDAYNLCMSPERYETDYFISKGDTIKSIIKKFGMTIEEFLSLNPTYSSTSALYEGRPVRIYSSEPIIYAYQVYRQVTKAAFSADVHYQYDSTKDASYSRVVQAGSEGVSLVDKFLFIYNDEVVRSSTIGEVILKNAIPKEIVVGSKSMPSFIWPTEGNISARFGVKGGSFDAVKGHTGLDVVNNQGTYIHAAAAGTVIIARWVDKTGWMITISHGNKFYTEYCHCSKLLVEEGDYVEQGQIIALMGNTGYTATGTHLHFAIVDNSENIWNYVDPLRYLPKR